MFWAERKPKHRITVYNNSNIVAATKIKHTTFSHYLKCDCFPFYFSVCVCILLIWQWIFDAYSVTFADYLMLILVGSCTKSNDCCCCTYIFFMLLFAIGMHIKLIWKLAFFYLDIVPSCWWFHHLIQNRELKAHCHSMLSLLHVIRITGNATWYPPCSMDRFERGCSNSLN